MTNLREAYEVLAYLRGLGIEADVEPIAIRYHDLYVMVGHEVVVKLPNGKSKKLACARKDLIDEPQAELSD